MAVQDAAEQQLRREAEWVEGHQELGLQEERPLINRKQGSSSSSSSSKRRSGGEGRQDLGLPHHLLISILALLPLPKLFELRLVCKLWNALLRSPALLEPWSSSSSSSHDSWLVMVRKLAPYYAKEFIAYSPSLHRWFTLPLGSPAFSSDLGRCSARVAAPPHGHQYFLSLSRCAAASAGGLMCFVVNAQDHSCLTHYDDEDYRVLVLNVLTRDVTSLPPSPLRFHRDPDFLHVSMSVNSTVDCYHVFLYGYGIGHLEVYDSKSRSWKVPEGIPAPVCTDRVLQDGDLLEYRLDNGILTAYSIQSEEVYHTRISPPPLGNFNPTLFRYNGRLLLAVGLYQGFSGGVMQGFAVWELRSSIPGNANWILVARTPPACWEGFYDLTTSTVFTELKFTLAQNLICMTGINVVQDDAHRCDGKYFIPLVYDLVSGVWYHLPGYKRSVDFIGLFSFQPSFTSMV